MRRLTRYLLAVAAALAAFGPARALAAEIVPPGNSGVNQYTQTVPTAGGNVAVQHQEIRQPKQVLGKQHAHELEEKGPEGKAAAELAATSSPPAAAAGKEVSTAPEGGGGEGGEEAGQEQQGGGVAGGGSGGGGGSPSGGTGGTAGANTGSGGKAAAPTGDGGSSALGQIVRQATGSTSSGELGLLMPLVLLAGLAWCIAFAWRQRRPAA